MSSTIDVKAFTIMTIGKKWLAEQNAQCINDQHDLVVKEVCINDAKWFFRKKNYTYDEAARYLSRDDFGEYAMIEIGYILKTEFTTNLIEMAHHSFYYGNRIVSISVDDYKEISMWLPKEEK